MSNEENDAEFLAQVAAERQAILEHRSTHANTRSDQALMLEDGLIVWSTVITHLDRPQSGANRDVPPDDPDYEKFCRYYNLKKPGDVGSKAFRYIDKKWISDDGLEPCE